MNQPWVEALAMPVPCGRSVKTDKLIHVNDSPNGAACEYVCPNPGCDQPLIVRNNNKKKIHHFAYIGDTCTWSGEYLLAELALEVVSRRVSSGSQSCPTRLPEQNLNFENMSLSAISN